MLALRRQGRSPHPWHRRRTSAEFADFELQLLVNWQSILTIVEAGEGVTIVPWALQYRRDDDVIFRPLRDKRCKVDAIIAGVEIRAAKLWIVL